MTAQTKAIQYASFASNRFEIFAACFALRSLQLLGPFEKKPILFVPEDVLKKIEEDEPAFKLQKIVNKCDAKLKIGFRNGFNPRNSFRVSVKNIARKVEGAALVYFSPTTIFRENMDDVFGGETIQAARSADNYWPNLELYGPSMDEIWRSVMTFAGVDSDAYIDSAHPENYWKRYPNVSPNLFYLPNPALEAESLETISKELIEAAIPELVGQERDLVEAAMAAFVLRSGGEIIDPAWDQKVISYDNFSQLLLRLSDENYEWFYNEIIETPLFRQAFKKMPFMRAVFYTPRLRKMRESFDEVEKAFSPLRINLMIERRGIDRQLRRTSRMFAKKQSETAQESDA